MSRKLHFLVGALAIGSASPALADGVVLRGAELGAAEEALQKKIAEARARDPEIFATVEKIDSYRPARVRRSRSQRPAAVGIVYRRLGARARFALADLAVFHAPDRAGLDDRAWSALKVALVDAIGAAHDPDLAPILRAVWETPNAPALWNPAAIGLGGLGAPELPRLLAHAQIGDPRFFPSLRGLGASHRSEAVAALVAILDRTGDEEVASRIADALGEAGSSWGWQTGALGPRSDGDSLRAVAARAIVRNYLRFTSAAPSLETALGRVAHPTTPALIEAARAQATPADRARYDRLAAAAAAR